MFYLSTGIEVRTWAYRAMLDCADSWEVSLAMNNYLRRRAQLGKDRFEVEF